MCFMASILKQSTKKNIYPNEISKTKNAHVYSLKEKSAARKAMLRSVLHPDYVLFDWEFFSNQLEFE